MATEAQRYQIWTNCVQYHDLEGSKIANGTKINRVLELEASIVWTWWWSRSMGAYTGCL